MSEREALEDGLAFRAREALRAEGAAAEREAIRLDLLAAAERQSMLAAAYVLSDFSRRLEVSRDAFAGLDHSDLPGECPAILWHGPGHQSRSRCQLSGPHAIHETVYGSSRQYARWEGDKAFTGAFNEPPADPVTPEPVEVPLSNGMAQALAGKESVVFLDDHSSKIAPPGRDGASLTCPAHGEPEPCCICAAYIAGGL